MFIKILFVFFIFLITFSRHTLASENGSNTECKIYLKSSEAVIFLKTKQEVMLKEQELPILITHNSISKEIKAKAEYVSSDKKRAIYKVSLADEYSVKGKYTIEIKQYLCKLLVTKITLGTTKAKIFPKRNVFGREFNLEVNIENIPESFDLQKLEMIVYDRNNYDLNIEDNNDNALYRKNKAFLYIKEESEIEVDFLSFTKIDSNKIELKFMIKLPKNQLFINAYDKKYSYVVYYGKNLLYESGRDNYFQVLNENWKKLYLFLSILLTLIIAAFFVWRREFCIENGLYSLARLQILVWTIILFPVSFYLALCSYTLHDLPLEFNWTVGALLGIDLATPVLSRGFSKKVSKVKRKRNFFQNILQTDGQYDILKLQLVLFNLLAITYFFSKLYYQNEYDFSVPSIPESILGILTASNGVYIGGKLINFKITVNRVTQRKLRDDVYEITIEGSGFYEGILISLNSSPIKEIKLISQNKLSFEGKLNLENNRIEIIPIEGNTIILEDFEFESFEESA